MNARQRSLTLRPERDEDRDFIAALYASTRAEELAQVAWPAGAKEAFLAQQFQAQRTDYRKNYSNATFDVIELDGEPVGRLYVDRLPAEIRIIDIALLPEARGKGIGSALLSGVLDEARHLDRPVTIHVERFNRALALYQRLGFELREDRGVYLFLEWRSGGVENAAERPCSTA